MTKDEFWRKKQKAIRLASKLAMLLDEIKLKRNALTVGNILNSLYPYNFDRLEEDEGG